MANPMKDEYYGEFLDLLNGTWITQAKPRPKYKLSNRFQFKDPNGLIWIVPSGTEVDGASIPQMFWSVIGGPFEGAYINASVIHDYYCDVKIRTEHDTHRVFYYGMMAEGVETWRAKLMYWAVASVGPKWKLDRSHESYIKYGVPETSQPKETAKSLPSVDLEDPEVLAAVFAKASVIARTLKTTDGEVLDITSEGTVSGDLDSIEKNSTDYNITFTEKSFRAHPDKLGVLSNLDKLGLGAVKPWKNSQMPSYDASIILDRSTVVEAVASEEYFRLAPNMTDILANQIDNDNDPSLRKQYSQTKYLILFLARDVDLLFEDRRKKYYEILEFIGNQVGIRAGMILPPNNAIERNFDYILNKDWKEHKAKIFNCNPGVLIIDTESVGKFNPNIHPWVILSFKDLYDEKGDLQQQASIEFTGNFVKCINNDKDIFDFINQAHAEKKIKDVADIVELKPEIFGCSLDIKKFLRLFKNS
jgi:hypothetical protein